MLFAEWLEQFHVPAWRCAVAQIGTFIGLPADKCSDFTETPDRPNKASNQSPVRLFSSWYKLMVRKLRKLTSVASTGQSLGHNQPRTDQRCCTDQWSKRLLLVELCSQSRHAEHAFTLILWSLLVAWLPLAGQRPVLCQCDKQSNGRWIGSNLTCNHRLKFSSQRLQPGHYASSLSLAVAETWSWGWGTDRRRKK